MRLAFACRQEPWLNQTGGPQRNINLILGLAREHQVSLFTFTNPGTPRGPAFEELQRACVEIVEIPQTTCRVADNPQFQDYAAATQRLTTLLFNPAPRIISRWYSPEFEQALRERREAGLELAVAARPAIAEMAARAGFNRVLLEMPDLESELVFRELRHAPFYKSKPIDWLEWLKLRRYDRRLSRRFWRMWVCKDEDRRFLPRSARGNVFVVPNGTREVPAARASDERDGEFIFVGGLSYQPNMDAVFFFHDEIFPRIRQAYPSARFTIVGLSPDPSITALDNGRDCFVYGSVEDVGPYYERASIAVVPMRLGAGTKLKVVEALVRGKALVSTTFGAEGFDLRPGVDLEIADTATEFADRCIELLRDPARRARLGAAGRARVVERYTWDSIVRGALELVR